MDMGQRIARLEQQNHLLKMTTFAILVLAGFTALAGAKANQDRIVRAEKFELVDERGRERGELSVQGYGARLLLRDCNGEEQLMIYAAANPDDRGRPGTGALAVKSKGTTRVIIQGTNEGGGDIVVQDENGDTVFKKN